MNKNSKLFISSLQILYYSSLPAPAPLRALSSCIDKLILFTVFFRRHQLSFFSFSLNITIAAPAKCMTTTPPRTVLPSMSLSEEPVFGVSGAFSFTISVSTVCAYATVTCWSQPQDNVWNCAASSVIVYVPIGNALKLHQSPSLSVVASMRISLPVSEMPERINLMPSTLVISAVFLCTFIEPVCSLLSIVASIV